MTFAYLKYIFALILFGLNGIIAARIDLTSYEIVFFRVTLGGLTQLAFFLLAGKRFTFMKHKRAFLFLVISGVANGLSWMFLYESFNWIGVGVATLFHYCGPLIVMVLSPLLFNERLTKLKTICFIVVFAGVILLNGKLDGQGLNRTGLLFAVLGAVCFAVMMIFKKKSGAISGVENALLQTVFAFIPVTIFLLARGVFPIHVRSGDWPMILLLGIVHSGMLNIIYLNSIIELPVQAAAILGYLEPLSAVVFSSLILREVMSPAQILGAAMILGGAIVSNVEKQRRAMG